MAGCHLATFYRTIGSEGTWLHYTSGLKSDVEFVAEGAKWKVHSRTKCQFRVRFEFRVMKKTSADRRPIENSVLAFHPLLKQIFEVNLSQYITNIAST